MFGLETRAAEPGDLGVEEPNQIVLKTFPARLFSGKKRTFNSAWYGSRRWLEYSIQADAAFCYPCRKFRAPSSAVDSTFTLSGFCDWKHAVETGKGLNKHASSKEHQLCEAMWRDKERRVQTGTEIATLVNTEQLQRNRYYLSAIIDAIEFLTVNQLPFRGDNDGFDSMSGDGCGLFLSLFEYTLRKDPALARIAQSIPHNARYTSHDIQNNIIDIMSTMVTEQIVKEVGESFYTIKVDGTRDSTGTENISIVVRFVNDLYEPTERLLTISTTDKGDAATLTDTIIEELTKAGLSPQKIISQVYDGASLMSGKHGGVQKLLQQKLHRDIPYVHCFNHQLHLVVIHALTTEQAFLDFFTMCNMLYKFCRKPTVSLLYKGQTLKRLLDQRWTGHLGTVSVILRSFDDLATLLREVNSATAYPKDVRVEATGLLQAMSEPSFRFIVEMAHKILSYLAPPNTMLQAEDMDLFTGLQLVNSACTCVENLRSETEFMALFQCCKDATEEPAPKRQRTPNTSFAMYVVEERITHEDPNNETELRRLYFSCIDAVCGAMKERFGERNCVLMDALTSLDPEDSTFLDVSKVKPLLDLSNTAIVESEYTVARRFLSEQMKVSSPPDGGKWTMKKVLKHFHKPLEAMPSVMTALKHALTFGASTALCENSFSTLKNILTDHRLSMLHRRKANLIKLAFEKDLTKKFREEWKDSLLRRFHSAAKRRLPLY
uniref:TTF-type domain-containing protein n=1 Tax=Sander lucioperca TaxID=283035 RepID=A0A8C9YYB0_SANLU